MIQLGEPLTLGAALLMTLVGLIVSFLGAYFSKWATDLAAKENLRVLTHEVEEVKNQLNRLSSLRLNSSSEERNALKKFMAVFTVKQLHLFKDGSLNRLQEPVDNQIKLAICRDKLGEFEKDFQELLIAQVELELSTEDEGIIDLSDKLTMLFHKKLLQTMTLFVGMREVFKDVSAYEHRLEHDNLSPQVTKQLQEKVRILLVGVHDIIESLVKVSDLDNQLENLRKRLHTLIKARLKQILTQ